MNDRRPPPIVRLDWREPYRLMWTFVATADGRLQPSIPQACRLFRKLTHFRKPESRRVDTELGPAAERLLRLAVDATGLDEEYRQRVIVECCRVLGYGRSKYLDNPG